MYPCFRICIMSPLVADKNVYLRVKPFLTAFTLSERCMVGKQGPLMGEDIIL